MSVLISARSLTKSFGPRPLFVNLSFDLRAGEKIGLIGPNGAGKSTLLKILADMEVPDAGERTVRRGSCIGYLPQDDEFPKGASAREAILTALANEPLEDYERESRTAIALTAAGFEKPDQNSSSLSGGWRKRLAVARALALEPDFLLLDEPTNHLDLPGILWLEKLLRAAEFGYLAATHDRAFLRGIADEVMEISRVYPAGVFAAGGFEAFAEAKDAFLEAQEHQRASVANQVRRESDWLGRKESAQRKKSKSRIEAAANRRAELADLNYRTATANAAGIDFAGTGRQTRKLLSAKGIGKKLGGRTLFKDINVVLTPGMKLGLLGTNGSGKSTILKMLAGEWEPDIGAIARAEALRIEVFEQGRSSLDLSLPLRRALSPNSDEVLYRGQSMHVSGWANRFLFRSEQLDVQLSALSGGEQARVRIAQLMLRPADVLLLDEPTNDLDMAALEVLEESLADFPGAVVLISHDRELIDRLCTEYIGLDGRGGASPFGSVAQWLTALERERPVPIPATTKSKSFPAAPKTKGLSFKEQQEYDGMEAAILAAEEALLAKQAAVESAAIAGHEALAAACRELEEAQHAVERLFVRWQELSQRAS